MFKLKVFNYKFIGVLAGKRIKNTESCGRCSCKFKGMAEGGSE